MKEKQSFLKHFFIIGGGTIINMLVGLLTTPVITRLVDPVEYGQLSIFMMYSNLAVMILCLGLDQALVRFYYQDDSIAYKRALLFRCIKLPIIITFWSSVIIILLSVFKIVSFEFTIPVMILLSVCVFVQLIYRFSLLLVRLAYKSKKYSFLNVLQKLTYVVLAVGLLYFMRNNNLLALVIATVSSYVVCMIVSILMQPEEWDLGRVGNEENIVIPQRDLLKYAIPFILSMSITQLFHAIDKISLNHFCTYAEVGVYSSAMTLVQVFAIVQTSFNTVWAPMQVEHYTKDPEDHSFYKKANQVITVVMFFLGLSLILAKDIFAVLLGNKYREAAYILPFLIFNPIMYTISETTCGGIVFMKKSKMQIVVAVGACITNIIGNTLLVPALGCRGAAISTGISYIVFFSLRTFIANKYYYTDFNLKKFYLFTAITCVYAYCNTFYKFGIWTIVSYIFCVVILLVMYKDTIFWGIQSGRSMIEQLKKRQKSHD